MSQPLPLPRFRILVVDDEALVGRAVRRVLSDQDVTCSTSAREALELLCSGGDAFHLVLCDLMMPDMTGPEFRAELLARQPEMSGRLVFITGGAYTPDMERFLAESDSPHVLKPFDVPELRRMVAERLAAA